MTEASTEEKRKEARQKGMKSSFDFFLDYLTLSTLRQYARKGTDEKGTHMFGNIPGHEFQLMGVILIILVVMIIALGAALGGLMLLT